MTQPDLREALEYWQKRNVVLWEIAPKPKDEHRESLGYGVSG